jgi:hypothetical protein
MSWLTPYYGQFNTYQCKKHSYGSNIAFGDFFSHLICNNFNIFFFSFDRIEVWTQGFTFAKQAFCCLRHTSSSFCSGYFRNRVLPTIFPDLSGTLIFQILALLLEQLYQSRFVLGFFWARVLQTICLGWLRTGNLLNSASWVARITNKSHWFWALFSLS